MSLSGNTNCLLPIAIPTRNSLNAVAFTLSLSASRLAVGIVAQATENTIGPMQRLANANASHPQEFHIMRIPEDAQRTYGK